MKKIVISAAALIMIFLFDHSPCQAVPAPHDFGCLQCHVNHNALGSQTNDLVCFSCHNPSGGAKAQGTPFSPSDAAHPYSGGAGLQSSHNWSGSDTSPQAGAQPPLSPALALKQHEGRLLCSKCHNLHGPRESATNSAPFLRTLNDQDQMCFDCHRSRNTQSHVSGSHPVMVKYSAAVAARPSDFYATPRSSNPANPTASLKLSKGQVVCSSCHGVHYTDSDSSTFDNRSSALLGRLKPSSGNLLRTDARGKTADGINICTNCHKGMTAHNAGGENIQCVDCHGGHVDEGDGSTPNVWLVRRFMVYSSFRGKVDTRVTNRPVRFTSTVTKNYLNADGTGVCQTCHRNTSLQAECSQPDKNCNACHRHNSVTGAFSPEVLECTSCHGQPPISNVERGPFGYAEGYLGVDESASAHAPHVDATKYLYTCNDCHNGAMHGSGNFQQVFVSPAGTIAASFGATASYNANARTCTSYCHSNGAPRGGTTSYVAVPFANSKGSIIGKSSECASCHGAATGSYNNLNTGAHLRHVSTNAATGKQYGCVVCHSTVATSNSAIGDRTKHVNGVKEIGFSGALTAGTTSDGASCSTNYCHSNGRGVFSNPTWAVPASGQCGSCHATVPALGSAVISTGAHFAHFSSAGASYGPQFSTLNATGCQGCHNYIGELASQHVDGTLQVSQGDYSAAGTGTCFPCHKQTVSWTGGQVSCQSCHTGTLSVMNGKTASDMTRAASKGHGRLGIDCTSCHSRISRHAGGGARLADNLKGSLNLECNYCHNSPARVANPLFRNMSTHMTVKGGGQQMACSVCHDPHGSDNLAGIRSVINGKSIVFRDPSDLIAGNNQGLCQVCHTSTNHYRAGQAELDHPASDCLNCHKHNAVGGAFVPLLACDGCHGYPPMPRITQTATVFGTFNNWTSARFESYSGGGGAHLLDVHVPRTAKASEGWVNCTMCHNGGRAGNSLKHLAVMPIRNNLHNMTIDVDPQYRFDNSFTIYTGAKLLDSPARNTTGSCFNISCHMTPSLRWSIER